LVIVTERELGLIPQVEVGGKIVERRQNFLSQFLTVDLRSRVQLLEMVLIGPQKTSKDGPRRGGGAGVKAVADGGVDAREGVLLGFFQNGEEPPEEVAGVGVGFV